MDFQSNIIFHYPPDLFNLLVQTIPLLCKSKKDVITFLQGAGVSQSILRDLIEKVETDRQTITKFEIVRVVLTRLNQQGETTLRERREILKRVIEFEDFNACWPDDQLKAKGAISEVRKIVNVKDSFTRMRMEREAEKEKTIVDNRTKILAQNQRKERIISIKNELLNLFKENNHQRRGKQLEGILNNLFSVDGLLVREAFTLEGEQKEGIIEQIDGVVEIDGNIYLVEMKWWNSPLGIGEVSEHLVRVYSRGHARAILISASGYTEPAIKSCRDALRDKVFLLCKLEELVLLLEQEKDLREFLKAKIQAAIIDKNPLFEPLKI